MGRELPLWFFSGDRVSDVESAGTMLSSLMNKKPQGALLIEKLQQCAEVAIASSSNTGKATIQSEVKDAVRGFDSLFREIGEGEAFVLWKGFWCFLLVLFIICPCFFQRNPPFKIQCPNCENGKKNTNAFQIGCNNVKFLSRPQKRR